jgi:hypothetical protein
MKGKGEMEFQRSIAIVAAFFHKLDPKPLFDNTHENDLLKD